MCPGSIFDNQSFINNQVLSESPAGYVNNVIARCVVNGILDLAVIGIFTEIMNEEIAVVVGQGFLGFFFIPGHEIDIRRDAVAGSASVVRSVVRA